MLDNDMKEKLLNASSLVEVKEIVKDCSELNPEKVWEEAEMRRSGKNEKLDLEELDAVSGGKWDRDWVKDGCVATCEYNSWCGSNDFCYAFDVTYDHFWAKCPDGHDHVFEKGTCVRCGFLEQNGHPGLPR